LTIYSILMENFSAFILDWTYWYFL